MEATGDILRRTTAAKRAKSQDSPKPSENEKPACEYCGDLRSVKGPPIFADGVYTPRLRDCPKCVPERPSGIPVSRMSDTFATFDLKKNPGAADAIQLCQWVAAGKAWCALLIGTYGTGKTHLAIATLNAMGRGHFEKVPDLLDSIRKRAFDEEAGMEAALKRWRTMTSLLVLDDLGTEKQTEWVDETLYRILDARYESRLPTILTSNTSWERLDGRIKSRFGEGVAIIEGKDIRLSE